MRISFFSRSGAALLVVCAGLNAGSVALASSPKEQNPPVGAQSEVLIKAPLKAVWDAVHEERHHDPEVEYSRVLHGQGNMSTIEQKLTNIPILGSVIAVTRQVEVPYQRIDYKLVQSDKFKAMQGSWEFVPANGGKETVLRLSSHLDVGVPFSGMFIKNATRKKIERRLHNVKKLAERGQAQVAAGGSGG